MDTRRRSYAFGPITITIRRGGDDATVRRVGVPVSALVHILLIVLVVVLSAEQEKRAAEQAEAKKPPVEITFYDPLPPPPKPKAPPPRATPRRAPKVKAIPLKPPPPVSKPLRMQPAPDSIAQLRNAPKNAPPKYAGQKDTRPAGGLAGGPLPKPTNGVPPSASLGHEVDAPRGSEPADEPTDLQGRLRAFRRALEEATPPTTKGPKGGGSGPGGIIMPQMNGVGFGGPDLVFEGNDYDWSDYSRQIYWEILRAWYRRLLSDSGIFERWAAENRLWMLDHTARVRFTIERSGQVVDVAVEGPSGCYPLDDSAREALQEVVLPPLPDDFQRPNEVVHARFIAEGDIHVMRGELQRLQAAGWF